VATTTEIGASEEALLNAARGGDLRSFSALVRLHEERAIRLAHSLLGNWEDARDAAQEAFVKAYQGLPRFKGEARFGTWLHRIIVNGCKDFLRKKTVRRFLAPAEEIPAREPGPLQGLLNQELGETIRRALEALPFQQRSVFALRYLEGFGLDEIAAALGLSVGAVKAHLWQAGQKMKRSLGGMK
jgi:RNA polymerase sigma-70 factor (ECF subfamily)